MARALVAIEAARLPGLAGRRVAVAVRFARLEFTLLEFATLARTAVARVLAGATLEAGCGVRAQLLGGHVQQQRHVAVHQLGQRGGDLDRRHVLLALVALDQVAELAESRCFPAPW